MVGLRVSVVVLLLLAGPLASGQQADLAVAAQWLPTCDPCVPGDVLTLINTVTNLGPDTDTDVRVQVATPLPGTQVIWDSWSTSQGTFDVDPQGDALWCDRYYLACGLSATLGEVAVGSTVTLTYDVVLDLVAPPARTLRINEPPDLVQELANGDLGWPVTDAAGESWGIAPWYYWDLVGDAEWVDDGTGQYGEYGCFPLQDFTPGKVAMVFRGPLPPGAACEYGLKALNAQSAGAIGVIIVTHSVGISDMSPGEHGAEVTIPTLMIPMEIGNTLHNRLALGETVNFTFPGHAAAGPAEPWDVTSEGTGYPAVWAYGTIDPDCCPITDPSFPLCCSLPTTDNLVYTHIVVEPQELFTDGLESGDSSMWTFTMP